MLKILSIMPIGSIRDATALAGVFSDSGAESTKPKTHPWRKLIFAKVANNAEICLQQIIQIINLRHVFKSLRRG